MDELISTLRARQGERTQAEFAAALGLSEAALSRILSGDRLPGREILAQIFRVYPDLFFVWLYPEQTHTIAKSSVSGAAFA